MAPHSSTLTWKIPWAEEPGRLQSMGSLRVGHDWMTSLSLFTFMHWRRNWQSTPVFLPGESQRWENLVGSRLWGWLHRVGYDWSNPAAAAAKLLVSPSYLNAILAGCSNLGCRFFFFHHFKYVLPFFCGLKSFYWKISCYRYGNPLVCYLLFFPCCF